MFSLFIDAESCKWRKQKGSLLEKEEKLREQFEPMDAALKLLNKQDTSVATFNIVITTCLTVFQGFIYKNAY